jgi:DNA polymerase-3 subunit beta
MKFTIDRDTLQKELTFVQGVVERKNTIPVLANVLIESAGTDSVRISGTDLDVTIHTNAIVEQMAAEGSICVPARKLFDIARLLPAGSVTFTRTDNDWVIVQSASSTFKLPGIAKETFPDLPAFKATPLSINASLLKTLIDESIFAITQEEGRYTLSGAKLEIENGRARMVTTDGHRLVKVDADSAVKTETNGLLEALIPRKTLAELTKVVAGFDGDVNFGMDENHIYFQVGTRTVISRMLAGQFPNYEMVLPKNNDNTVTFGRVALNQALKRVALMADDRSRSIVLEISEDQTVISAQSPEEGEGSEVVTSKLAGANVKIGFNASYLQDVLNCLSSEEVIFTFKDPHTQTEFRPAIENGHRFCGIVMPMRTE